MNDGSEKPTDKQTDKDAWEKLSKHPEDRASPLFLVGVLISVVAIALIIMYFHKHGGVQI